MMPATDLSQHPASPQQPPEGEAELPQPRGQPRWRISLFWRTFVVVSLLLLGFSVAWFQAFRFLEEAPRALQGARQLASLVNLTRAALEHADPIARVSLIKTLIDKENVHIEVREPNDVYLAYDQDSLSRRIAQAVTANLGKDTVIARQVNEESGLWIGFEIGQDTYWLLTDPERIGVLEGTTWLVWLGIALTLSFLGAGFMARVIDRPLKKLSQATARIHAGQFHDIRLAENVATNEIREVNMGFNRMAEQLAKVEQDRALMLAGISHDLRTPLARLRLEAEMSVPDDTARELMAADIEQANAIINKFMDYARPPQTDLDPVALHDMLDAIAQRLSHAGPLEVRMDVDANAQVRADGVELRRVFSNLLENALRYGQDGDGLARVDIQCRAQGPWLQITVRDHGPGVPPEQLPRLTDPFFRGNEARTSATGSGLGLAIVKKAIERMGGEFRLTLPPGGGLQADILLKKG